MHPDHARLRRCSHACARARVAPREIRKLQALLEDIVRHPAETSRRLVLADHLMENGEGAWGELVAAQCALAEEEEDEGETFRPFPDSFDTTPKPDARTAALRERVKQLMPNELRRWKARFGDRVHHMWFWRGFPEKVSVRLTTLPL